LSNINNLYIPFAAPRITLLVAGIVLLLAGCSASSPRDIVFTPDGVFPDHKVQDILRLLPERPDRLERMALEAQISVSSPDQNGRFTAIVHASGTDSLLARIRFPLGIEGARVLIAGDSAFVYDRIARKVFRSSVRAMEAVLPGSFVGNAMVEETLGFLRPDMDQRWLKSSDSTRYYLYSPDSLMRYTIDPAHWRIEQIQQKNARGEVVEQRWYLDFNMMDDILVPRRSILSRPHENTRVAFGLKKLDAERTHLDLDLNPKDNVTWVDITG